MKNLKSINYYGLTALLLTAIFFMVYPPKSGSGQDVVFANGFDSNTPAESFEIAEYLYDIENLSKKAAKIVEEKLNEPPRVVVKTKIKTVVKERDSAAIWVRHPDGSLERVEFSTKQVPTINLVADTVTVKVKRKWLIFGEYKPL